MTEIQKSNYLWLWLLLLLLSFIPVQSQTNKPEIILTWSANSYTPLNYSGRALPTNGSQIEVIAEIIPKNIDSRTLNFRWFLDDKLQEINSGLGRDVFRFIVEEARSEDYPVRLEILNQNGTIFASGYQLIKIVEPQIALETKVLVLDSLVIALPKYRASANQEIKFMAQPYFFNIKKPEELEYSWNFNNQEAVSTKETSPQVFILKIGQVAQTMRQVLNLSAQEKNNPLQKAVINAEINLLP